MERIRTFFDQYIYKVKSGTVLNVLILVTGTGFGQLIAVVIAPVLTRLYSPEDFGNLAVFQTVLAIVVVVSSLKYELAIPIAKDDLNALRLLFLSIIVLLIVCLLSFFVVTIWGDRLVVLWGGADDIQYFWLLPFGVFFAGLYNILIYWSIRSKNFVHLSYAKVIQNATLGGIQTIGGVAEWKGYGLIIGLMSGHGAGSVVLLNKVWQSVAKCRQHILGGIYLLAKRYRRFPMYASWGELLSTAAIELPAILVAMQYGVKAAGFYALTQRVLSFPVMLIGKAMQQVYISEFAELLNTHPRMARKYFLNWITKLAVLSILPIVILVFFSESLFTFVFGAEWSMSGQIALVMVVLFGAQFIVSPVGQTLNILERQSLQLVWNACRLASVLVVFYVSFVQSMSLLSTILLYSIVVAVAYLVLIVIVLIAVNRLDNSTSGKVED